MRGLDSLGSGLDELHHIIGVGDHRHMVRRDFDGGDAHAGGELAIDIFLRAVRQPGISRRAG